MIAGRGSLAHGARAVIAFAAITLGLEGSVASADVAARLARGSEPHWPRQPLLLDARDRAGVTALGAEGLDGAGTMLCVIDTGLDLRHEDFIDESGASRVAHYLSLDGDETLSTGPLAHRHRGWVLDRAAIDRGRRDGTALPTDWHGHGTAITSVAAGDGGSDARFRGMAPAATLVIVDAYDDGLSGFGDDDLAAGVSFCRDAARDLVVDRWVVVLANGGHDGAHDGTSLLERQLDRLARDGLPIFVAAGNDGGDAIHGALRLGAHDAQVLTISVPRVDRADASITLAVRTDASLAITLADETSEWVAPGGHVADARWEIERRVGASSYVTLHPRRAGLVLVHAASTTETTSQRVDAWLVESLIGTSPFTPIFLGDGATRDTTIRMPGTAREVFTVGAGPSALEGEAAPEDVARAPYSSVGPTVDGRAKPELLAPGGPVIAARTSTLADDPRAMFGGRIDEDREGRFGLDRVVVRGTSVAVAVAAGATLLVCQTGDCTAPRLRRRLLTTSDRVPDDDAIAVLDAARAVHAAERDRWFCGRSRMSPGDRFYVHGLVAERSILRVHGGPIDQRIAFDDHVWLGALDTAGIAPTGLGSRDASLDGPARALDRFTLQLGTGDARCELAVTLDPDARPVVVTGGCSAHGGRDRRGPTALLLLTAWWWLLRAWWSLHRRRRRRDETSGRDRSGRPGRDAHEAGSSPRRARALRHP